MMMRLRVALFVSRNTSSTEMMASELQLNQRFEEKKDHQRTKHKKKSVKKKWSEKKKKDNCVPNGERKKPFRKSTSPKLDDVRYRVQFQSTTVTANK
jgi:hypothetical protein